MESFKQNPNLTFASVVMIIVLAFAGGVLVGNTRSTSQGNYAYSGGDYDQQYINDLYARIKEEYLGEIPSNEKMTHGIAKGLVEALGDEYSAYLAPTEAEQYLEGNASAFEGIGVQLDFDGKYTIVETPMDGYPGQKAGMLPKDIILEVDGEDVAGIRPEIVATKIRGEGGTKVKVTVYRESENRTIDFELTRERIDLENISFRKLDNGIVVIDITKFTEGEDESGNPVAAFNSAWDKIVNQVVAAQPKGVVIDLRNNPGGFVQSVRYVAEEFLSRGQIVMQEESKNGDKEEFRDYRDGKLEKVPVTVLVNTGSASASEILAGAIQDNSRGQVIGEKTVGKGVEQKVLTLPDKALLMIVFKRWLTPNGTQLSKESPITPNIELKLTPEDITTGNDAQLNKAVELLTK